MENLTILLARWFKSRDGNSFWLFFNISIYLVICLFNLNAFLSAIFSFYFILKFVNQN